MVGPDVVAPDGVGPDVVGPDVVGPDVVGNEFVLPRDTKVLVDVVGEVLGDPPHAAITKLAAATKVAVMGLRAKLLLLITSSRTFQVAQDERLSELGYSHQQELVYRTA